MPAVERVHARRIGRRRVGQMSAAERVHVRKMREKEGRTNVCSREGTCEKDKGRRGRTMSAVERVHARTMRGRRGGQCLRQRGYM